MVRSKGLAAAAIAACALAGRALSQGASWPGAPVFTFEENTGQEDACVRFVARSGDATAFLTGAETVLALPIARPTETLRCAPGPEGCAWPEPVPAPVRDFALLRLRFDGANPDPEVTGEDALAARVHHLTGRDRSRWRTGVRTFARVRVAELYPCVDQVYYERDGKLEFDLVLAPGADPGGIRLAVDGAREIVLESGAIVLGLEGCEVRLSPPAVYQIERGVRRSVPCRYVLTDERTLGFELAPYETGAPLVIDPGLGYSTFLGGSGNEGQGDIVVDGCNAAFVVGTTSSVNYPTSSGAFAPTASGSSDFFVAKLDPQACTLVWATYLGGSAADEAYGIDLDPCGRVFVAGHTDSTDWPTTSGALSTTYGGGGTDCVLAVLDAEGSGLEYSTYVGGVAHDRYGFLDVDQAGRAYLVGLSNSNTPSFPTTPNSYNSTSVLTHFKDFLVVVRPDGLGSADLAYGTFFGTGSCGVT